jgi:DNA-binding transcriptional ArsR family regulator
MVLRIHFTAEDLARTRISPTLGPLAETVMALTLARCPNQDPAPLRPWRRIASRQLTSAMRPLATLIPPGMSGVDLSTLTGQISTIEEGIHALLAIPGDHLRAELEQVDRRSRLPETAWALTEAGGAARQRLADAVGVSYQRLVEPYWTRIRAQLDAERTYRGQVLTDGGVERLLSTLSPRLIRWRPPVLEVVTVPGNRDVYLNGRGIALVPSVFVGDIPVLLQDLNHDNAIPRLVFCAIRDPAVAIRTWAGSPASSNALAALVGRTRAAALGTIGSGCTTTELARRIGVSPAAASQHTAVLRGAGLITTHRHGSAVLHALTPLGAELLEPGQASASSPPAPAQP